MTSSDNPHVLAKVACNTNIHAWREFSYSLAVVITGVHKVMPTSLPQGKSKSVSQVFPSWEAAEQVPVIPTSSW